MKNGRLRFLTEVLDSARNGWLSIKKGEEKIELPFSTKLFLIKRGEESEIAKVLEGNYRNCVVYIPYMIKNSKIKYSYLSSKSLHIPKADLMIKSNYLFSKNADLKIKVIKDSLDPGIYRIKFPVKRQKKEINQIYFNETKGGSRFAETWFPILKEEDFFMQRYIHFGTYSKGCVTISYQPKNSFSDDWRQLYMYLIRSRDQEKGDLGTLVIV